MSVVLVDAGALIAVLNPHDANHVAVAEALKQVGEPLATVWPALTEAMHLLGETRHGPPALCDMVADGVLGLLELDPPDLQRMKSLMEKYRDLPMGVADAALVAAERNRLTSIITFDRHFQVYRLPRRGRFTVIPG